MLGMADSSSDYTFVSNLVSIDGPFHHNSPICILKGHNHLMIVSMIMYISRSP